MLGHRLIISHCRQLQVCGASWQGNGTGVVLRDVSFKFDLNGRIDLAIVNQSLDLLQCHQHITLVGSGILVKTHFRAHFRASYCITLGLPMARPVNIAVHIFGSDNIDSLSPGVPAEFHHSSPSAFLTWEIWNSPDLPVVWHPGSYTLFSGTNPPKTRMLSEVTVAMLERNLLRLHQNFNDKAMLTEHHEEIWMRIWVCPAMGIQQRAYRYTPKIQFSWDDKPCDSGFQIFRQHKGPPSLKASNLEAVSRQSSLGKKPVTDSFRNLQTIGKSQEMAPSTAVQLLMRIIFRFGLQSYGG